MPAPFSFVGRDGKTYPLTDNVTLPAGLKGEVHVDAAKGSTVKLYDFTYPQNRLIADDWQAPYDIDWTVPMSGQMVLGVEVRAGGNGVTSRFKVIAQAAAGNVPDSTGSTPIPTPLPDSGLSVWPNGFGCCCDYGSLYVVASILYPMGVRIFRCFMPGMDLAGNYSADHISSVEKLLKAFPDAIVIGLHGTKEADDSKGRKATPPGRDARKRFWSALAKDVKALIAKYGNRYWIERNNEVNAKHYLDFGQNDNLVSPSVVQWCLEDAQDCREAMGPAVKISDNSIGWNASNMIHLAYKAAFKAVGIYDDGLTDFVVDHAYPDGGIPQIDAHLAGLREIVGPSIPIHMTEIGSYPNKVATAEVPVNAAGIAATCRKYNVVPEWYRGHCSAKPRFSDDRSLLNRDGTVNKPLCKALGLPVTA